MNKYSIFFLLAFSALTPLFARAAILPIPLTDPPQAVQTVLNDIQSAATTTTQQVNTILAFKTRVSNGLSGLQRFTSLDSLQNMLEGKINKQMNDVFGGPEFRNLVGDDIAGQFNVNDLAGMNLDKLGQLGMGQAGNLTQDQLGEIIGKDLASRLTEDQIRSLLNDPKGLMDFFNGTTVQIQQASASNQGILNIVGTKKDVFKKKTAAAASSTPNGNRSDAFGGTGNGSTPQAEAALESFKAIQSLVVEKAQLPIGQTDDTATADQIRKVREVQMKLENETAVVGLSNAWLRQTLRTRSLKEQEKEMSKKMNEAKDEREAIKAISYATLIGVEAQNYANETFAENLKVFAAQTNQRVGNTSLEVLPNTPVNKAQSGGKSPQTGAEKPSSPATK